MGGFVGALDALVLSEALVSAVVGSFVSVSALVTALLGAYVGGEDWWAGPQL